MLQQVLAKGEQQHVAQFDKATKQLGQAELQSMRPQAHAGNDQSTLA